MTSQALVTWTTNRLERLKRLERAHAAVSGAAPGRRWETDELNQAILLRLAAEFQGFCRDLHDESVDTFVRSMEVPDDHGGIVSVQFKSNRRLDAGNATPGGIGSDFARFGLRLWPGLTARNPTRASIWNERLTLLNMARNGIAHDDWRQLESIRASGWPLTLSTARTWRSSLDGLAKAMDNECKQYLANWVGWVPW